MHETTAARIRLPLLVLLAFGVTLVHAQSIERELIFPLDAKHDHGSSIVEAPSGMLLVSWFRGSGERQADDVAIYGATKSPGGAWSEPFVLADTPGFPDTNCTLLVDDRGALWLFWPTILDNRWESALLKYKVSHDWDGREQPVWSEGKVLHMKPGDDFAEQTRIATDAYLRSLGYDDADVPAPIAAWRDRNLAMAEEKLTRRLGWFTRPHPIQLAAPDGRIVVGLYSDGFSFSMTTFTDDYGATWRMSEPIVGGGNVQPSLVELPASSEAGASSTLLAFMRDNGPPPKLVQVSSSADGGETWSVVRDHLDLVDSGAGVEALRLRSGRILVVHNDTPDGRNRLALSLSEDDGGERFRTVRYLEDAAPGEGRYHYPSMLQSRDPGGTLHVTYSVHLPPLREGGPERKSIGYASFGELWLLEAVPEGQ